ncbi:hypothetical protein [Gemmatimonas sp.]|uniref:hypothetical protein n=1 Tax=Gemmatimonas sp. TaxID=1962908 RepID=UPI003561DF6A
MTHTKAVVQYSGGVGSWGSALRAVERFGRDNVTLLFADVLMEDEDLYRFLEETEADIGIEITRLSDGRNPWQVFRDVKFVGNTRIDPCSKILKRDLLRQWIDDHCDPAETLVVLGIDWTEDHRLHRAAPRWEPFTLWAPLCDEPYIDKVDLVEELKARGVQIPRLYTMGFPHNNCGGFCVKAGQAQFKKLLDEMPERYKFHEQQEQETRVHLGKDVAILRDRRGGTTKPMTLKAFRERIGVDDTDYDAEEWGGCGCAID